MHALTFCVGRSTTSPSTVVMFAVLRFFLSAEHNVRGWRQSDWTCLHPPHTHSNYTNLCMRVHVCVYILVRVRSCARILRVGVWRRSAYWFCVVSLIKSRERVYVRVRCVCMRINSFHLYFALINCDLISNTRSSTAETRYQHRHAQHVVGASAIKIQNKSYGQCNHLATA